MLLYVNISRLTTVWCGHRIGFVCSQAVIVVDAVVCHACIIQPFSVQILRHWWCAHVSCATIQSLIDCLCQQYNTIRNTHVQCEYQCYIRLHSSIFNGTMNKTITANDKNVLLSNSALEWGNCEFRFKWTGRLFRAILSQNVIHILHLAFSSTATFTNKTDI